MKIGFIGSGPICQFHLMALNNNGFSVEAIGSRKNSERCNELAHEFNLESKLCKGGWQEVLEQHVDAYCICIDISKTAEILEKAMNRGKPILVEKPIAWHLNKFDKLINNPNSDNVFVGYNRRYYKTINKVKDICKGLNGGTILVNIPDSIPGIRQFLSNGCHVLDSLRYIAGDFDVLAKTVRPNINNDDIESITALCENNKWKVIINAHSLLPSNFSITINSGKNVLELKPIEKYTLYEGMNIIDPTIEEPIRKYMPAISESIIEPCELKPGFDNMYNSFRIFCETKTDNLCDLSEARATLQFCEELIKDDIPSKFKHL